MQNVFVAGGAGVMIELLLKFPKSLEIAQRATRALAGICLAGHRAGTVIRLRGGYSVLFEAVLPAFGQNEKVLRSVLEVFSRTLHEEKNCQEVVKYEGIELINKHFCCPPPSCFDSLCKTLATMCSCESVRPTLIRKGMVTLSVNVMRQHKDMTLKSLLSLVRVLRDLCSSSEGVAALNKQGETMRILEKTVFPKIRAYTNSSALSSVAASFVYNLQKRLNSDAISSLEKTYRLGRVHERISVSPPLQDHIDWAAFWPEARGNAFKKQK